MGRDPCLPEPVASPAAVRSPALPGSAAWELGSRRAVVLQCEYREANPGAKEKPGFAAEWFPCGTDPARDSVRWNQRAREPTARQAKMRASRCRAPRSIGKLPSRHAAWVQLQAHAWPALLQPRWENRQPGLEVSVHAALS